MQSEHQLVANLSDALLKLLQAKGKLEPVSQREQAQLPLGADQHGRSWGGSDNYGLPASSPVPENGTARPDVAGWQACSPSDAPVDELAWSSYHRWSSTVAGNFGNTAALTSQVCQCSLLLLDMRLGLRLYVSWRSQYL